LHRRLIAVLAVAACLSFFAVAAFAALPTKGGQYEGLIKSTPFQMRIVTAVAPTGTKLRFFTYLCGTGRPPTTVFGIPIDATGHFKWSNAAKGWKMAGHFVSATKAFISLNSIACGGSKGSTTLTLKPK
jgi:hypothetical protein